MAPDQPFMRRESTAAALAAVRRMSFTTLGAREPRDIHRTLAAEMFEVFAVDQIHVCRVVEPGGDVVARSTSYRRTPDGAEVDEEYDVPAGGPSGVNHVARTGEPLNVEDAPSCPLVSQGLRARFQVASMLYVPLAFDERVDWVVLLISHTRRVFQDHQVNLAFTMANQASAGLAVLEMRERLSDQAERQSALARAARALNASLDTREVLSTLCAEAVQALGGTIAGFYLGDEQSGGVAVAAHGIPKDSDWWGYVMQPGEGVAGKVLSTGRPAISNDYTQEISAPSPQALRSIDTALSVPVGWDGEQKGALSVAFSGPRKVTDSDIDALQAVADLAGVACSNAEAFEEAQQAARTDSLTGFLNHGAVQARLREEIWRARRSGGHLSCALVDLDNFKPINDRHGHLVGDQLLQRVAAGIASALRPYDAVARFGGDEFVVVLPGVAEEAALEAAVRVRESVEEAGRSFGVAGVSITASVGVAQWREPLTAGELIDRADRALLLAKRQGKNALIVSSPESEEQLGLAEGQATARTELMTGFWDLVAQSQAPGEILSTMPAFLRRRLELNEVALFEPSAEGDVFTRLTVARAPGDPGNAVFGFEQLRSDGDLIERLQGGALARGSLADLACALSLEADRPLKAPAGSYAAVGMTRGGRMLGLLLLRVSALEFPLSRLRLAETVAAQAVTVLLGQSGGGSPAVEALAAAIDARDNYTHSHSEDVVALACDVAQRLELPAHEVDKVRDGALLHDVGKVAIPNEILYKPGPLDPDEWAVMRQHPVIGEGILKRTPELALIAPLVRHEHERWDGHGYPDGLAGEDIPIGSRIILVCDAYNAMITERPYRKPMSHEDALAELGRGAGTQFDPRVVDALVHVLAAPQQAQAELA